ncbi:diaminopimelate epimerase [uncultured Bacteroides sp.]|uniref:diaminopimelate epimerase n=1 Tax=uncultured Bacteroides sp. TaxID=162156 RepID=UPI002AA6872C|nr:diaminopimelate epimerase [uncultured Bacteroides sp.]
MTRKIKFTKMHGAGNDYIYVDCTKYPILNPEELSILWSKPHTGIGSDGLVLIDKTDKADFSMRIFNADGSEAMMCGNATRCIAKYIYENGLSDKSEISLDTLSGIKILKLQIKNKTVTAVTVDMGVPSSELVNFAGDGKKEMISEPLTVNGATFITTAVSMGNPHLVIFVEDIATVHLSDIGPKIENLPIFPDRINVEFAQVLNENEIRMRVWERGSGITQACGTGACATIVAAIKNKKIKGRKADIIMDGGTLTIEWDEKSEHVFMTGTATKVFEGEIEINN